MWWKWVLTFITCCTTQICCLRVLTPVRNRQVSYFACLSLNAHMFKIKFDLAWTVYSDFDSEVCLRSFTKFQWRCMWSHSNRSGGKTTLSTNHEVWGSGGIAPCAHNLCTVYRRLVNFTPCLSCPRGKSVCWIMAWEGASRSARFREEISCSFR
jgi:hypothetical protein